MAKSENGAGSETAAPQSAKITLKQPIGDIKELTLRKPAVGEMRGMMLGSLAAGDVGQLTKLLARISAPPLSEAQVASMDLADFTSCFAEINGFLQD